MKVSVIVVTLNEEKNIVLCLQSILKQNILKNDYEIIIVDGGSQDATQQRVKECAKLHDEQKIRYIEKQNGSIAACRNIGIKNALYEYVAFTDADCIVPEDWLQRLRIGFSRQATGNPALAGVGGANIPPENGSLFQMAIGVAFNSLLGSLGSIQAQPVKKNVKLFSISCSNSFYKKKSLEDVGMFSEELGNQGEDWDLGAKLKKNGYNVYGIHDSFVWHNFRATPALFWKNMVFYGDGRMLLMTKHPDIIKKRYLLPLFFIPVFVFFLIIFLMFWDYSYLVPFLYFPLIFIYSLIISFMQKKVHLIFYVFVVFVLQHFGYSFGEWKGLRWFLLSHETKK